MASTANSDVSHVVPTHTTFISRKIMNPIGDGDTFGIGREIMIKNPNRTLSPSATGLMEKTDFFPAFGIDTDHGHPLSHIVMDLASDISKLKVAVPGIGRIPQTRLQGLEVHSQRTIHVFQQPAYRVALSKVFLPAPKTRI
jgi:hypothetical protein